MVWEAASEPKLPALITWTDSMLATAWSDQAAVSSRRTSVTFRIRSIMAAASRRVMASPPWKTIPSPVDTPLIRPSRTAAEA